MFVFLGKESSGCVREDVLGSHFTTWLKVKPLINYVGSTGGEYKLTPVLKL